MLREILQNVHERDPDLAGRRELPRVIPVAPHAAVATARPVHRLGDANHEALHAADEAGRRVGFDHQVDVVLLCTARPGATVRPRPRAG